MNDGQNMGVVKFICHSHKVSSIAVKHGWLPGARYTNLRDVSRFDRLGFLDIDWHNYNFKKHLTCTKDTRPIYTVARDIIDVHSLNQTIEEAYELLNWAENVIIVPKDIRLASMLPKIIPDQFVLGFSVPSKYGQTSLQFDCFKDRQVHLLGGHPVKQRSLADKLRVISIDCNRFTLDARFGDYFDGDTFRPHPMGGYEKCIIDSIRNINDLWVDYHTY